MREPKPKLSNLFDAARNEKPAMPPEEVVSLVEQQTHSAVGSGYSQNIFKQILQRITPMKAYTFLALAGLSAGSWYYYAHQTPKMDAVLTEDSSPTIAANDGTPVIINADTSVKQSKATGIVPTDTNNVYSTSTDTSNLNKKTTGTLNKDSATKNSGSLLYSSDRSTMKIALKSFSLSIGKDSLDMKARDLSSSMDSIRTIFIEKRREHTGPNTFMDSVYDVAIDALNGLSIDTSNPGNPAIAINKKTINEFSVENGNQEHVVRLYSRSTGNNSGNDSGKQPGVIIQMTPENNRKEYSSQSFPLCDTLTMRIDLNTGGLTINKQPIDGELGGNLFAKFFGEKEHLNAITIDTVTYCNEFYNGNSQAFVDKSKSNADSTAQPETHIIIHDAYIGDGSIASTTIHDNQRQAAANAILALEKFRSMLNAIHIVSSTQFPQDTISPDHSYGVSIQGGDSSVVMQVYKVPMDSAMRSAVGNYLKALAAKHVPSNQDTVTLRMNLSTGYLSIDSVENFTPITLQKLNAKKSFLNAYDIDIFTTNVDNIRDYNITLRDRWGAGHDSTALPIAEGKAGFVHHIHDQLENAKSILRRMPDPTGVIENIPSFPSIFHRESQLTMKDDTLTIKLYKSFQPDTGETPILFNAARQLKHELHKNYSFGSVPKNAPADTEFLAKFIPYSDSPDDSCTISLAKELYKFRTDDSLQREERLTNGKPNSGMSRIYSVEISTVDNVSSSDSGTTANRKTEEYYGGNPNGTHEKTQTPSNDTLDNLTVQIPATRVVTLSADHLAKLGIISISSGVCVYRTENFQPLDQYFQYFGMGGMITMNTCRFDKLNNSAAYPALTTDDRGEVRLISYNSDKIDSALAREAAALPFGTQARFRLERKLSEEARLATMKEINTFVPVKVSTGRTYTAHDSALGFTRPDMIFWYEPTPQLLALLPDTLHVELTTELARVDSTMHKVDSSLAAIDSPSVSIDPNNSDNQKVPPLSVNADSISRAFFDISRSINGAIAASLVYPNPANGEFTIQYTLNDARTVNITMHDINGKQIRNLGEQSSPKGTWSLQAQASGISPGIYLIALTTDKGEQAVQRIIIEK